MNAHKEIPKKLAIVVALFIAFGFLDLWGTAITVQRGRGFIDFGFVTIFVGYGLLRFRRRAHQIALALAGFMAMALPILTIGFLLDTHPWEIYICGFPLQSAPTAVLFLAALIGTASAFWQFVVLRTPEVIKLYYKTP